jgi:CheY-like chemotaxis protein
MNTTRILVVDDEPSITRQLKRQLEATKRFEVRAENSGQGAVRAAREFKPDVVLLDVMMPELDGGAVSSQIQAMPELRETLIIYLTAISKGTQNTREIFLDKPVDLGRILACIGENLARRRGPQGSLNGSPYERG